MKGKQSLTMEHRFLQEAKGMLSYTALSPQTFKSTEKQLFWELRSGFSLPRGFGEKLLKKICLTVPRHR